MGKFPRGNLERRVDSKNNINIVKIILLVRITWQATHHVFNGCREKTLFHALIQMGLVISNQYSYDQIAAFHLGVTPQSKWL